MGRYTPRKPSILEKYSIYPGENSISIMCVLSHFSCDRLFATPWTVARQAPLSRQEYWSGLPCPPPGDLPNPGTEPESLVSPAMAGRFFTTSVTWETSLALKTLVKSNYFIPYTDLAFTFNKEMEILDIGIRPHQTG